MEVTLRQVLKYMREIVAVGPGGSRVRAAKVWIESHWPLTFQLFSSLVTSVTFFLGGEGSG